ncbi:Uncharacterised protein [Mycobacterium tuberculosis]|nr:Uncharacterised protein [Mycobacterium tuberculosis]SGO22040.1 Uncharacterised protein [Mycobacterium tuberculosis]
MTRSTSVLRPTCTRRVLPRAPPSGPWFKTQEWSTPSTHELKEPKSARTSQMVCCRAAIVRLRRVSDTTPSNTMDVGFAGHPANPICDVATV